MRIPPCSMCSRVGQAGADFLLHWLDIWSQVGQYMYRWTYGLELDKLWHTPCNTGWICEVGLDNLPLSSPMGRDFLYKKNYNKPAPLYRFQQKMTMDRVCRIVLALLQPTRWICRHGFGFQLIRKRPDGLVFTLLHDEQPLLVVFIDRVWQSIPADNTPV